MCDVATDKLQVNLRLDPKVVERINDALRDAYAPLPAPSRNAVIERWVMEGLERLEAEVRARRDAGSES